MCARKRPGANGKRREKEVRSGQVRSSEVRDEGTKSRRSGDGGGGAVQIVYKEKYLRRLAET